MIIITFVRFANLKLEFQVLKSDDNIYRNEVVFLR